MIALLFTFFGFVCYLLVGIAVLKFCIYYQLGGSIINFDDKQLNGFLVIAWPGVLAIVAASWLVEFLGNLTETKK